MQTKNKALEMCLEKALGFIYKHQKEFSITAVINPEEKLIQLKPFAELALTVNILKKYGYSNSKLEEIRSWLWQEIKEGDDLLELLLVRTDLIVLSCLYADFVELGFQNNELQNFIAYLSKINPIDNIENPYWRKLDIEYSLSRLGIFKFPTSPLQQAWLSRFLPPWTMNTDLAYAVTHEIFYVTDFGFDKYRIDNEIKTYLCKWLPSWTRIFAEQNNWDLTAEFLMVSECIGIKDDSHKFWDLLIANQHENGYVPSPPKTGIALFQDKDTADRREFLTNYHTTLVSIMALAMRLAR